jgi:predicted dehydrogenase
MENIPQTGNSRREFLKNSGIVATASALAGMAVPAVHAAENNTIQLALVGCGGRGTGAAGQALSVKNGPIKLVAMGDLFSDRLKSSYRSLSQEHGDKIEVPEDRKFVGFDAYKNTMDCLKPGDIVIFATPLAFRWVHFGYAIDKGLNVFMEKPLTADGPTSKKMLALGEDAQKKNLKVGVGLMCRHCEARQELHDRIRNGEMGDITLLRAYRTGDPSTGCYPGQNKSGLSDLLFQIKTFHAFLWAGGGVFSDYLIHNIDECCWMKDAWPVSAKAIGGRHFHNDGLDQNFDAYSVEYIFADGARLMMEARYMNGCDSEFASYAHGTKGSASLSGPNHVPNVKMYKSQRINTKDDLAWQYPRKAELHYQKEWDDLVDAVRENRPYNEVKRGVEASLVTSMGRMAAHTGKIVTFDDMLNSDHEYAPDVAKFTMDSPAPLAKNSDGKYSVPIPGFLKVLREFA